MSIIYKPTGKAREYSPLAANLYLGCNHACKYCYAPGIQFKTREDYHEPKPRRNLIKEFELDCKKNMEGEQVLFCFMTDPYNSLEKELGLTRECLKLALKFKNPVSILTKSSLVLRDIDLFKKFSGNIKIGVTLTFDNKADSKEWEPEAATPEERLNILKELHSEGIKTWASFEPVIIPEQSLTMMYRGTDIIDEYKIGKLNNFHGMDKNINWSSFLEKTTTLLRGSKKPFYIKHDLRTSAPEVKLYGNECLMDEFNLKWQ